MRASRFISHAGSLRDYARQLEHVIELSGEDYCRVGPLGPVAEVYAPVALEQLDKLDICCLQILVVTDDRAILRHQLAQFPPQQKWIFVSVGLHQGSVDVFLALALRFKASIGGSCARISRVADRFRSRDKPSIDTRH